MAIFETVLKSDLKKPVQVKQLSGYLFSGDNQGNKISVEVMDNGSPATLTGGVTGYVIREDNATVTISGGTLSGNKASIVLPEEAYNVVGRVSIVVKVGTVTVGACTSYVYKTSTDTLVDPTGAIPSLQELLAKISACEQATADANKIANLTVSAETATGSTPDAVLSETGSPAHKHITFKLVKGDKGDTGDTGATPQLSIGTVTTLQPSQNATVTITGTDEEPVLNFGIPQGASGNETIDDTAGLGDTDLVYSADKVVKLFRSEHEDLTSGNAEQVIGKVASTEKGAYLYRRGMHLGNRCREKVVGGTVAWNQLAKELISTNWDNESNVTSSYSNGVVTIASTTSNNGIRHGYAWVSGHKYLIFATVKSSGSTKANIGSGNASSTLSYTFVDTDWHTVGGIFANTSTNAANIFIYGSGTYTDLNAKNVMVFDLTAMFGSTVADALYAMGDAVVQWFRSLFPKDYYAYDAGSLQSVQVASKVIKDANNNTVHTYPFDTSLVLRGIPKLDSNNRLYYDGDEYTADGKVTRKYGVVDLGSLTWTKETSNSYTYFYSTMPSDCIAPVSGGGYGVNTKYPIYHVGYTDFKTVDKALAYSHYTYSSSGKYVLVNDSSYSDAATFKTAMSGVYIVYELATPTTEQASPFTPIMSFDPAGTEEFTEWGTRDVAIPVGHITEYLTDPAKILNNIPLIEVEKESASVVTFSDGAEGLPLKELTVKVEPAQDLHGYDNPWPAGGGKNQVNPANWANSTSNQITFTVDKDKGTITITGTASSNCYAEYDLSNLRPNTSYILTGAPSGSSDSSTYNLQVQGLETTIKDTGSGASFTTGSDVSGLKLRVTVYKGASGGGKVFYPMVRLSTVSDATFEPYSNICPISGWTGANVTRTGVNVWDEEWEVGTINPDTGANEANNSQIRSKNYCMVKPGNTYYIHIGKDENIRVFFYDKYYNQIENYSDIKNTVLTIPSNVSFIRFRTYIAYGNAYLHDISINNVSTDTTYHAYEGNSYHITFPTSAGTVYGGTLTVNKDGTGQVTVDKGIVDLGSLNYSYQGSSTTFYSESELTLAKTPVSNAKADVICSTYKEGYNKTSKSSFSSAENGTIAFYCASNAKTLAIKDSGYNGDASAFKTGITGQKVVFELATPIVYDLSPVEVTTLLGINNVWADTGDIALTYRADTKKYIDSKFAELSAAITALGT